MKTSNKGIEIITKHEGLVRTAYLDPVGIWTIGYGHTGGVKSGDVVSESQAEMLLRDDLTTAERAVNSHGLHLSQNQFDALVSLVFNIGSGNFSRSTLLRMAKQNANDPAIAGEYRKWVKGRVNGRLITLPGLVKRREAELKLYFTR